MGTLESTASLIARVRSGDSQAREELVRRYIPALTRWARGRLPRYARDLLNTDDLVQESIVKSLEHMGNFDPRYEGAFLAYLRKILLNRVRMEIRRVGRRPTPRKLAADVENRDASPLDQVVGHQIAQAYERALTTLSPRQQQAVLLRIELGYDHAQVAEAIGASSPGAARMLVKRALLRLAKEMEHGEFSKRP